MQNGILESDLNKYTIQLRNASDEAQRFKSATQDRDQKLSSVENSLRDANSKINGY